jgi:type III secretion protein U
MSGSSERKSKPASQQKLRKARRDGSVPQSQKVVTLIVVSAVLGAAILLIGMTRDALSDLFETTFGLIGAPLDVVQTRAPHAFLQALGQAVGPFLGLAVATAVLTSISYHRGIPFAMKPIVPDFARLNPAQGFKRMFGRRSWIEASVGLVQLVIWGAIACAVILDQWRILFHAHACGLPCLDALAWQLLRSLALAAIVLFLALAVLETVLQRALFNHEQRMTLSEYKREMKDNFGAPEIRRARARARAEDDYFNTVDIEQTGMEMANMCFFSDSGTIAIRYHPEVAPIPYICATGTGDRAIEIRNWIRANGFPELKSRKIVQSCLTRQSGTPAPKSVYKDLAAGIARMFR